MADNVLILGAGFSRDAGIPLLSGFVERMWEYAIRGSVAGRKLDPDEQKILNDALDVRLELDKYHGRAIFDDRNIEDVLSILAFNVLGGGKKDKDKFDAVTRAIATTIELSCLVKHPGLRKDGRSKITLDGPGIYMEFWQGLFNWVTRGNAFPTIITFNYDLVLERSLFQLLINDIYNGYDPEKPFKGVQVSYHHKYMPDTAYKIEYVKYGFEKPRQGTTLVHAAEMPTQGILPIDLLKLHGSLNFPKKRSNNSEDIPNIVESLVDPFILPPVSNKLTGNTAEQTWRVALNELRCAKNIVIIGYSLPSTDIYMQYFLRAALGPNTDLNRIFVFDPILFSESHFSEEMRNRYNSCFADQLRPRICYRPERLSSRPEDNGTLKHFIDNLKRAPEKILF